MKKFEEISLILFVSGSAIVLSIYHFLMPFGIHVPLWLVLSGAILAGIGFVGLIPFFIKTMYEAYKENRAYYKRILKN